MIALKIALRKYLMGVSVFLVPFSLAGRFGLELSVIGLSAMSMVGAVRILSLARRAIDVLGPADRQDLGGKMAHFVAAAL